MKITYFDKAGTFHSIPINSYQTYVLDAKGKELIKAYTKKNPDTPTYIYPHQVKNLTII